MAPNILLILIDDLGWRDLSCYGSSFYETPRLDRLAAEGVRFTDAYATCPVCSPSRASILSGKYPARVGLTNYIGGSRQGRLLEAPYVDHLPLAETSVASALREGGYQTWHVGKWHLGDEPCYPEHHGFDVNIGGCHWGHPKGGYFSPWKNPVLPDAPEGTYLTDHLTDRAIDLIRHRDKSKPFFLNLWHYAVHTPIQAPPDLVEKYRRKAAALGLDKLHPFTDGGRMPVLPQKAGAPWAHIQRRIVQSDPAYAAMVENLDTNIGRVLDALESDGLGDDTLVVFSSDNGGLATAEGSPTCNAPLSEGKGWDREGGVRVCQIVRWPRETQTGAEAIRQKCGSAAATCYGQDIGDSASINNQQSTLQRGLSCSVPVQSCDLYPTFLEAAGLPLRPQQHCDGVSLMPLLRGESISPRALFWHFPHYGNQGGQPAAWVLRDGWKLIHRYAAGTDELFHLPSDISESRNLAAEQPGRVAELRAELEAWQRDAQARYPTANPEWELRSIQTPDLAPAVR